MKNKIKFFYVLLLVMLLPGCKIFNWFKGIPRQENIDKLSYIVSPDEEINFTWITIFV